MDRGRPLPGVEGRGQRGHHYLAIRDFTPSGLQQWTGSGIFFADGRPKPAYTAFRFPFVTDRKNRRTIRAWGKAPAGGKLVIQRKRGKRWLAVKKLRGSPGAGVSHQAAVERQVSPPRRGRRQPQPHLGAAIDPELSVCSRPLRTTRRHVQLPRERHAFEKGPGNRRGPGRLSGDRVSHGGDGQKEKKTKKITTTISLAVAVTPSSPYAPYPPGTGTFSGEGLGKRDRAGVGRAAP